MKENCTNKLPIAMQLAPDSIENRFPAPCVVKYSVIFCATCCISSSTYAVKANSNNVLSKNGIIFVNCITQLIEHDFPPACEILQYT